VVEVNDVAVIGVEVIQLRFTRVGVKDRKRLVSPGISPHMGLIEEALLRIGRSEFQPKQFRSSPEIDQAAIGGRAAAGAGSPAIAKVDRSGEPVLSRRDR